MSTPSFRLTRLTCPKPRNRRTIHRSSSSAGRRGEQGQAFPLVAVVVALAIGLAVLVAHQGRVATDRARARTAADAAALAAAGQDDVAARVVAARNGATVVAIRRAGSQVEVEVKIGDVGATSRAGRSG